MTLVFISHNSLDKDIAREIGIFLVAEQINVWFDDWVISAGDSIIDQVDTGLKDCTHFIIVWSKNSATSKWVGKELSSILKKAIEQGVPKIIPVIIDDTPLPILLQGIKSIQYNGGNESDRTDIITAINGDSPTQNLIKAIVKKYHEVVIDDSSSFPLPYNCCPHCGSQRIRSDLLTDYVRDETYFCVSCLECDWNDCTQ